MIDAAILTAIGDRLVHALAAPRVRLHPFIVDGHALGFIDDQRATRLAAFADVFHVRPKAIEFRTALASPAERSTALDEVARALAAEGALSAWRDERYAVAPAFGAPLSFHLERAAARYFGVHTYAAHANGVVAVDDGTHMWLARRSAVKAIDPGKLDNLIGGGIAAGATVRATLFKEGWEEAGIDAAVALETHPAGAVHIRRLQPDGLHWETIFVHDLWLPETFLPANQDGEAIEHRIVTLDDAARLIAIEDGVDEVTADASLVVLDFLIRHGHVSPDVRSFEVLDHLRHAPDSGEPRAHQATYYRAARS